MKRKLLNILGMIALMTLISGTVSYEVCGDGALAAETDAPETTEEPDEVQESQKPAAMGKPSEKPEAEKKKGWYGKGKKRYYIKKDVKKAKVYQKIKGKYYFFKNSVYAVVNSCKTISWNGKKYRFYFKKDGSREMDVSGRLNKETGVSYLLETNLTTNSVMVYAKWKTAGYVIPVKRMRCSVGMPGHSTIQGTYHLSKAGSRWHVLRYGCYGQYCSRIKGPFLFHSVVYQRMGDKYSLDLAEYKKLGKAASHGCVRLQVEDAKWIYEHSSQCTAHLYAGKKEKLPIPYPAKKKAGKTSAGKYYDPTDLD
ncbi:MAG: L,D-transpeptidase [Lachnospiraceae bacterium]|nr:L,D-transpeptidase [Lachnospiraceae bacterium]